TTILTVILYNTRQELHQHSTNCYNCKIHRRDTIISQIIIRNLWDNKNDAQHQACDSMRYNRQQIYRSQTNNIGGYGARQGYNTNEQQCTYLKDNNDYHSDPSREHIPNSCSV